MGNTGNNIQNDKIKQIIEYYLLNKKFENIFINGYNELYHYSRNTFEKITNHLDITLEEELYIIDINWIDYWKEYSGYEKAKTYFDQILLETKKKKHLKKNIEEACQNMLLTNEINSDGICPFPMDNEIAGRNFANKLILDLKNLSCLVTSQNYWYLSQLTSQNWHLKTNTMIIKAIIRDTIIILIFEKKLKVKFIYF